MSGVEFRWRYVWRYAAAMLPFCCRSVAMLVLGVAMLVLRLVLCWRYGGATLAL
jgi:hypothetical protein